MCMRACVLVLVCRVLKCALVCLYLCACSVCLRVLTCVCVRPCLYASRQSRRVCTFVRACRQSACVLSCVCVRAYLCLSAECLSACLCACTCVPLFSQLPFAQSPDIKNILPRVDRNIAMPAYSLTSKSTSFIFCLSGSFDFNFRIVISIIYSAVLNQHQCNIVSFRQYAMCLVNHIIRSKHKI